MNRGFDETNGRTPKRTSYPGAMSLAIDDGGAGGIPVVFLHSFGGNISHWSPQLEHLRQTRRAIAFDMSGHGQSKPAGGSTKYSIRLLSRDVEAVARALKLDRFVLVGHSLGAAVAASFAAAHPEKVMGLMLVDPPFAPGALPAQQVSQIIGSLKVNPYAVTEEYWKTQMLPGSLPETQARLLQDLRKIPRAAVIELTADLFHFDIAKELARYPGPKFSVVTAQNDAPLSLHNVVPNVPHVTITGTGHWIHLDKPAAFNAVLDDFLKRATN
jgi:pimeloyl-ACP methyl ester carboxylesterase